MDGLDLEYVLAEGDLRSGRGVGAKAPAPSSDLEATDPVLERPFPLPAQLGGPFAGLAFIAGVLLGWLIIGWWLWPVQWANSQPWHLRPAYQERFVALVAAQYWQTRDASQAKEDLAGWDTQALTALLVSMQNGAPYPQARQQLAALREALALPDSRRSLWASVLGQRAIQWSAGLAALPLLAALLLASVPRLAGANRQEEGKQAQGEPQALSEEGLGILQPWLEAFEDAEGEAQGSPTPPNPVSQPEANKQGKGEQEAKQPAGKGNAVTVSLKQALTGKDSAVVEQRLDLQDLGEVEDALSDLFAGTESPDSRLEALARIAEPVGTGDLVQRSQEILAQLLGLSLLSRQEVN